MHANSREPGHRGERSSRRGFLEIAVATLLVLSGVAPSHAAGVSPEPAGADWPLLHRDLRNSKWVALAGAGELVPAWHALDGRAATTFVASGPGGRLYALTMDVGPCHLHALDRSGNTLWCSDQVRTLFSSVAVSAEGGVFVTDGTEVFRFEEDGWIAWRVPATGPALAVMFTKEGYLLIMDYQAVTTVYDPATGAVVAGPLALPVGTFPRPSPLPAGLQAFRNGAPLAGWDPAIVDTFIDAFQGFGTAVGNNAPAVHPVSGRIFIAVPADPAKTMGVLYGVDFDPTAGALAIGCSAPMGLRTSTSPSISEDGAHVYAGDQNATLYAFDPADCSVDWSLPMGGAALASPTAGLDGRVYMLIAGRATAILDEGSSGRVLWQTDIAPLAQLDGFATGRFQSTLPLHQNYVYGAATYYSAVPGGTVPGRSVLAVMDPETGAIVSTAELGEESDAVVSLGSDGSIYVASKPIVKAQALGTPALAPFVPAPHPGLYAFEPESYLDLTVGGLDVAADFAARASEALAAFDLVAGGVELDRAARQAAVANANLGRATDRGELEAAAAYGASVLIEVARIQLETADSILGVERLSVRLRVRLSQRLIAGATSAIEHAREIIAPGAE